MLNLYWPIYKNLEKELLSLSDLVHFDEKQMSVYSVKISELLIRCSVEIESISKDLYINNGGTIPSDRDLYFDTDCLEFLENKWNLSKKKLVLSSIKFFIQKEENKVLTPLHKSFKRGTSGADWKKAYQAVKHERVKSLTQGNIGNLIKALGALFILNIYYKNEVFELGKDSNANSFQLGCGSDLFSLIVHKWHGSDGKGFYQKENHFIESIYYVNSTLDTEKIFQESTEKFNEHFSNLLNNHPRLIEHISGKDVKNIQASDAITILGEDEYIALLTQSLREQPIKYEQLQYEAKLNMNDI